MNLLFKYTKNDYIQNPTYISLLLHITQFTTQHASCYRFSVFSSAQRMCLANQSVLSHNLHEP